MSESVDRASRAETPSPARTVPVITAVTRGKCQNIHSIVTADNAKIAKSAATLVFCEDADTVIPATPRGSMP
jgi:hypothetical protein